VHLIARRIALALAVVQADAWLPIVEDVEQSKQDVVQAPEAVVERLEAAIEWIHDHPIDAAAEPNVQRAHSEALLLLAQAHLGMNDPAQAIAAIDEAVRIARGDPLPTGFGNAVDDLVLERLSASENAPRGHLRIDCAVPCRVILDERDAGSGAQVLAQGLPLGTHRLWILAIDAPEHHVAQSFTLSEATPSHRTTFDPMPARSSDGDGSGSLDRLLPRWAAILGITAGVASIAAGSILLALEDRCTNDLSRVRGSTDCPYLSHNPWSPALLGIGAGLVIGFTIPLAIGDARQRSRGRAQPTGHASR